MKRIILSTLIIFSIFLLTGCTNKEKFYLEEKYYNNTEFNDITSEEFKKLGKTNYLLFTYNNYCQFKTPCDEIFKKFTDEYKISIIKMPYEEFKKTSLHDKVLFAPSVIIVNDGKIVDYLDAEQNDDIEKYQDVDKFTEWVNEYIYLER